MNRMLIWRTAFFVLSVAALLTSGCATISKGSSQEFTVRTDPPGATCELSRKNISIGVVDSTPGTIQLGKDMSPLEIVCRKSGYLDGSEKVAPHLQQAYFNNFYFGGIVGMVVDAGSGAAVEYQSEIHLRLLPESFVSATSRDEYFEKWRDELRAASEKIKADISEKCPNGQCGKLLDDLDAKTRAAMAEVEVSRQRAKIGASGASISASPSQ